MKSERKVSQVFCSFNNLSVSMNCAVKAESCALIKSLKEKIDPIKLKSALKRTIVGTPGSRICSLRGWTTLMSEMSDGSQVCTCEHPSGDSITCYSLEAFYSK